jgi:membrane protein implicated in regulation of membrane protease activity
MESSKTMIVLWCVGAILSLGVLIMVVALVADSTLGAEMTFLVLFVALIVAGCIVTTASLVLTVQHFRRLKTEDQARRTDEGR